METGFRYSFVSILPLEMKIVRRVGINDCLSLIESMESDAGGKRIKATEKRVCLDILCIKQMVVKYDYRITHIASEFCK